MTIPSLTSIGSLETTLGNLSAGDRAWFWFCSQIKDEHPFLMITPFSSGSPESMYDAAGTIPLEPGVIPAVGVAAVGSDGRLGMASMFVDEGDLERFASWTKKHIVQHPNLNRLYNATLIKISEQGKILARHEDQALWEGIPKPTVAGTTAAELQILSKFKPGRKAWYWMTDKGPDGRPFFMAKPSKVTPEKFAEEVNQMQLRIPEEGRTAYGYVEVNAKNVLVFTSQTDADEGMEILAMLRKEYASDVASLQNARFLQVNGSRIIKVGRTGRTTANPVDSILADVAKNLRGMDEQSKNFAFWFTDSDKSKKPMLIISEDKAQLKAWAASIGGQGKTLRGVVKLSPKGWIEFRTKSPYPDLVVQIAGFVAAHHHKHNELRKLKGARVIQKQGEETVDRQKNDAAWSSIPAY